MSGHDAATADFLAAQAERRTARAERTVLAQAVRGGRLTGLDRASLADFVAGPLVSCRVRPLRVARLIAKGELRAFRAGCGTVHVEHIRDETA